jgi:hypothetical protein
LRWGKGVSRAALHPASSMWAALSHNSANCVPLFLFF